MKLAHIRHIVAVAEWGSLHATAAALGVSTNALVRSIGEAERELGAALFKRSKRTMTLTPVGEIFVRRAAAAQRELDQAIREIGREADAGEQPQGDAAAASPVPRDGLSARPGPGVEQPATITTYPNRTKGKT